MHSYTVIGASSASGFDERAVQIARRISVAGLAIVVIVFAATAVFGEVNWLSFAETLTYLIILGALTLSSFSRYRVKQTLSAALLGLFFAFWLFSLWQMSADMMSIEGFALALFIPMMVAMALGHRILFFLAPVQFILVTAAFQIYGPIFYSPELSTSSLFTLGGVHGALAAAVFFLLGLVQRERLKTDLRLIKAIEETERLASTDPLTGLLNRRAFMSALSGIAKNPGDFVITFIDLNNFKPLNDQYGHAAGDAVLCEVGKRLSRRPGIVFAARPGGDEFAILISAQALNQPIEAFMDSLHRAIAEDIAWGDGAISVGASIGYCDLLGAAENLSVCLSRADAAMRRAKIDGGGAARFDEGKDNMSMETELLVAAFPSALASGQIRAALQPIADARTNKIVAYELLARWDWAGLERQPGPGEFIPIAEKLGLLNSLLWQTLEEALTAAHLGEAKLAVNVSPGQLQSAAFLKTLCARLDACGAQPSQIILEVTEQVAFRNLDANVEVLTRAKELGMSVALDDFGTGYSSLSMLDALPLDKIKIDQSLVRLADKGSSASILKGAIELARQLGLTCCVEGVCTQEAANYVRSLGVDELQGFWIGRPAPAAAQRDAVKIAS